MRRALASVLLLSLAGCGVAELEYDEGSDASKPELGEEEQAFSSARATLMNFTFDGELLVPGTVSAASARRYIDEQLLYTIGHLNGDNAVGRLDKVTLSNIKTAAATGGTKVTYRAVLPVAWGSKTNLPATYAFTLPRAVGSAGLEAFTAKYRTACVDFGAHDVDAGSMWYYFRPNRSGCSLAVEAVVKSTATAVKATENTTGKFPEFHKVWEDNALSVVAIFGKYEDGAQTSGDAGIAAYNSFVRAMQATLKPYTLTTVPSTFTQNPGITTPDITFNATMADGKKITVTALLVDNVRTAGAGFDARYEALSTNADLIAYNGHAGLGANVRALATKGRFVKGKYVIVFMNGCDTYAYVDGSMAQTRAASNSDDPTGSKYMEIVTNAMPAFFQQMPTATMALFTGLLKHDAPTTYDQMFAKVDAAQVVTVTGEEDNVYFPGFKPGAATTVLEEKGAAGKGEELRYKTAELSPGKYTVVLAHDAAAPGGDADLYVKLGAAPTSTVYDCRPYQGGTNETCELTVTTKAVLFVGVVGYAAQQNAFTLTVKGEGSVVAPPASWAGINESFTVAKSAEKRFVTPVLPVGKYVFTLSGAGDADLYLKSASAPTTASYECRPYKSGSAEQCVFSVSAPIALHVMVRGYAASSAVKLIGAAAQ